MAKLEIACFNIASAIIAQENGANRVELCDNILEGGTTPSIENTKYVRDLITIDLFVMIRPRGGNFVYTDEEFNQMKTEITAFKKLGVDGFVFGVLKNNNSINTIQNTQLIELAKPLPCTFHRAFDAVTDAFQSLEKIIDCGFKTVLTSGQTPNVLLGIERLKELVIKAENRIVILPGGGLRSTNIEKIQDETRAVYFHSSAIVDNTQTANKKEIIALKANLK